MELLCTILGMAAGCLFTKVFIFSKQVCGKLHIDSEDSYSEPYIFLHLSKDLDEVRKKKYVYLEVDTKPFPRK